jgi:predicted N-formylglutamate amidohydrolase
VSDLQSIDSIALVERIVGPKADPTATPRLLVEVPHGADRRAHYDALKARMVGDLPEDLHVFFHVNTDVGAWQYGRRVAEQVIAAQPDASALLVRCLVPRTFVDLNRTVDATDQLATGGVTSAIPSYVEDPADVALLRTMHRTYEALIERAYAFVCDAGGFALTPHTYGPRSLPIAKVDRDIVVALRKAYDGGADTMPLRPEVDLITKAKDGTPYAPRSVVDDVMAGLRENGLEVIENTTYCLVPSTQTWRFATRYPDQVLCLEVRRDLLVEQYLPFEEMVVVPERIERVATPIAAALSRWLESRPT